jgi:hypothetical protein
LGNQCPCELIGFGRSAPGEREKDIIQGWATQGQIVQGNPGDVEIAHDRGELMRPTRHRHDEVTALAVDLHLARTVRAQRFKRSLQIAAGG